MKHISPCVLHAEAGLKEGDYVCDPLSDTGGPGSRPDRVRARLRPLTLFKPNIWQQEGLICIAATVSPETQFDELLRFCKMVQLRV